LTQAKPAGVSAKHGNDLANESLNFSYNLKLMSSSALYGKINVKKKKNQYSFP